MLWQSSRQWRAQPWSCMDAAPGCRLQRRSSANILTAWPGLVAQAPRAGRARAPCGPVLTMLAPVVENRAVGGPARARLGLDDEANSQIADGGATGSRRAALRGARAIARRRGAARRRRESATTALLVADPPTALAVTAEGASCAARAVPSGSVSCILAARRVPTDRFADGVPGAGREPSASLMTNASNASVHRSQEICVTTNTVRGRVGQKGGRVGQKSGRVAPRAWPSRGGLGPSGHTLLGRHRGDSDPPGATRGADWAHAGPTRSAEWDPHLWRVALAGSDSPLPLAHSAAHSAPRHYRARRHFLCGPFL